MLHKVVQMKGSQSTHNTVIQLLHETTSPFPQAKAVCRIPSTRPNRDQESNLTQPLLSFETQSKKKESCGIELIVQCSQPLIIHKQFVNVNRCRLCISTMNTSSGLGYPNKTGLLSCLSNFSRHTPYLALQPL